ncbi:hypothetical protein QAD02_004008 [Eretmocerus hayati]|uniref:Uncharacterized protein n=1 Tax=Eretmocerus hayati TaxID=131215 RepID=A0ACC2NPF2_9HYME|nr:hypothetical protein QAD02_004008 [Eretmocerus hayati]
MAPEPTQEPVDNLNVSNLIPDTVVMTGHDSDSDGEDNAHLGYAPLSQVPLEGEPIDDYDDDEDFEWTSNSTESQQQPAPESNHESEPSVPPEILEVWSTTQNVSNIDMDENRIDQVKSAMASFTLPKSAIPEWANHLSDDLWKEQLIHRIKEIQQERS